MTWDDYIKEVLERASKATCGPWHNKGGGLVFDGKWPANDSQVIHRSPDSYEGCRLHNAEFIAHSRTDVERLARRCLELEKILSKIASDKQHIEKRLNWNLSIQAVAIIESYQKEARDVLDKKIE